MVPAIVQYVMKRVRGLRGRRQNYRVITIGEYFAAAAHQSIEGAREPNVQSLHAARERLLVVRLDEKMQMIALHRVFDDLKFGARARGLKGALQNAKAIDLPEIANVIEHSRGDVYRKTLF